MARPIMSPLLPAGFLGFTSVVLLSGCYILPQAGYFLGDQLRARPIHRVEARAGTTEETKAFLARVRDITEFAEQELGLSRGTSYTRYIATEREFVAYVVSATEEFSFRNYTRRFPFVGEVPYLGFYRRPAADRLAAQLQAQGYDVWLRGVGAFSTLGYFSDPLYSYMAHYPLHRLANMLIHELAHATLWIPGEVEFNEQFATFVGDEGARLYIKSRYSSESEQYTLLEQSEADAALFRAEILGLRAELEALYADSSLTPEQMRTAKYNEPKKSDRMSSRFIEYPYPGKAKAVGYRYEEELRHGIQGEGGG